MSAFLQNVKKANDAPNETRQTLSALLKSPKTIESLKNLATQYMTPERMTSLAVSAVNKTPKLQQCNVMSLMGCFAASFALGLEPNTPLGHAYLIPYSRNMKGPDGQWTTVVDCQFQIGYKGMVALLERTGIPAYHFSSAVRENDVFQADLIRPEESVFKKALRNRGELVGAVFYMRRKNGGHAMHVMEIEEIEKIRACSETYRTLKAKLDAAQKGGKQHEIVKAQEKFDATPWVLWEDEMVAKSVLKRAAKMLDLIGDHRLPIAAAMDDAADGRFMRTVGEAAKAGEDVLRVLEEESGAAQNAIGYSDEKPMDTQIAEEPNSNDTAPNHGSNSNDSEVFAFSEADLPPEEAEADKY